MERKHITAVLMQNMRMIVLYSQQQISQNLTYLVRCLC